MRTADALKFFGGRKSRLAAALGISRQAIDQWGDTVPEATAYKIQIITADALMVDPRVYAARKAATRG